MYRISKSENIAKRPKWMVSLLLRLNPSLYEEKESMDKALIVMRYIKMTTKKILSPRNKKVMLIESAETLTFCDRRGKPILDFSLKEIV